MMVMGLLLDMKWEMGFQAALAVLKGSLKTFFVNGAILFFDDIWRFIFA